MRLWKDDLTGTVWCLAGDALMYAPMSEDGSFLREELAEVYVTDEFTIEELTALKARLAETNKVYLLNDRAVDVEEFIRDNEHFTEEDIACARGLPIGEVIYYGGGAVAESVLFATAR